MGEKMKYDGQIIGKNIILRTLELADCQEYYVNWLNDNETNQYLESRWSRHDINSVKNFVSSINNSEHSYIFAIIQGTKHIGNIKIGPIDYLYKFADIGYLIGEKSYWGKGYATETIGLILKFAFETLKLHRVEAGAYEQNIGSQKALIKNGFVQEGIFRKRKFLKTHDMYCDSYKYSILKEEWEGCKQDVK